MVLRQTVADERASLPQVMPLFHLHAISINLLATAVAGAALVAAPRFDAALFYEWLLPVRSARGAAAAAAEGKANDAPRTVGHASVDVGDAAPSVESTAEELALEAIAFVDASGQIDDADPDCDALSSATATAPLERHERPAPNWYSAVPSADARVEQIALKRALPMWR